MERGETVTYTTAHADYLTSVNSKLVGGTGRVLELNRDHGIAKVAWDRDPGHPRWHFMEHLETGTDYAERMATRRRGPVK